MFKMDSRRVEQNSMHVNVYISSQNRNSERYELFNVRSVKNLSLPEQSVTKKDIDAYRHLNWLNNGYVCNSLKIVEGNKTEPCASKTRLGWILHGGCDSNKETIVGYHKFENLQKGYIYLENVARRFDLE